MANPYQSSNPPPSFPHHEKATALELFIILLVIIMASIGYGYYRKTHDIINQSATAGSTSGTTSNTNNPAVNSNVTTQ